jgi:hypothetical protein
VHLFGGLKDVLSSDWDTASETGYATTPFGLSLIIRFGGQILNQGSSGLNDSAYNSILLHFCHLSYYFRYVVLTQLITMNADVENPTS